MNKLLKEYLDFIKEAPIEDISHVGNVSTATNFTPGEIKMLQTEKYQKRIKDAFKNTPFVFDIVFLYHDNFDASSKKDNADIGDFIPDKKFTKSVNFNKNKINGKPGVITFVSLGNLSPNDRLPMTPWILAHKIGHSIVDDVYDINSFTDKVMSCINTILKSKNTIFYKDNSFDDLFSFRSWKKDKFSLRNTGELGIELIALYLIKGEIKANTDNEIILKNVKEMNDLLFKKFNSLKGKVLNEV